MANYLYVDNSNVWIEGMRVSAVSKGIAPDLWTAIDNRIVDYDWKIDFGKLHEFAGGDEIGQRYSTVRVHPQTTAYGRLPRNRDSR
jgi:hypothetical protein